MSALSNVEKYGRVDCMPKIAAGYEVLSYTGWMTQDLDGRVWRRHTVEDRYAEHICNADQVLGFTPKMSPEQIKALIEQEQNDDIYDVTTGKYLGKRKDVQS